MKPLMLATAPAFAVIPALAGDMASAEETAKTAGSLARIGREPGPVAGAGTERADLREVAAAQRGIGRYDIKPGADFTIASMTLG